MTTPQPPTDAQRAAWHQQANWYVSQPPTAPGDPMYAPPVPPSEKKSGMGAMIIGVLSGMLIGFGITYAVVTIVSDSPADVCSGVVEVGAAIQDSYEHTLDIAADGIYAINEDEYYKLDGYSAQLDEETYSRQQLYDVYDVQTEYCLGKNHG